MAAGYVISDLWLSRLNENAVGGAVSWPTDNWAIMLFVNDRTISDLDQSTGSLEEASFAGYARQLVDASSWVVQPVNAHVAKEQAPDDLTFTNAGGPNETVYGYAIIDNANALVMAESFAAGAPVADGGTLTVKPALSYKTCR